MTPPDGDLPPVRRIPELDRLIAGGRYQLALGHRDEAIDALAVTLKTAQFRPSRHIPDAHRPIVAGGHELLPVWSKRKRGNGPRQTRAGLMSGEHAVLAREPVSKQDSLVGVSARDHLTVGRDRQSVNTRRRQIKGDPMRLQTWPGPKPDASIGRREGRPAGCGEQATVVQESHPINAHLFETRPCWRQVWQFPEFDPAFVPKSGAHENVSLG